MTFVRPVIVLVVLLCGLNNAYALQPSEIAAKVDPSCRQDMSDPADVGYRLTENSKKYANQCINGVRFRPIKNMVTQGDVFIFDNYVHESKYWRAQVSVSQVEAVYFQIVRFPVAGGLVEAAHTEIRFALKKGSFVSLTRGEETSKAEDVMFSFEAGFPEGVFYDFAKGVDKNYARLARVLSTAQKQFENPSNAIEQYELKLTQEERVALFKNAFTYSYKLDQVEFYNTLRPNCTTEVFDLIDALPRFEGKFSKFMTMASLDPIAAPSIAALERRDLIMRRVQNFSDEQNGIYTTLQMPIVKKPFEGFLPTVAEREWAFATVLPDESSMTTTEKAALESLRQEMIVALPSLFQSYASVMLLTPDGEKGQGLFLSTLKEFVSRLPVILRKMNDKLPENETLIRIYFTPDIVKDSDSQAINAGNLGLPIEIPFAVHNYRINNTKKNSGAIFAHLGKGFAGAMTAGIPQFPDRPFMSGLAITINAQKNKSKVTSQVLAGLNSLESAMASENSKVAIEKLVVPKTPKGRPHVGIVITHVQDAMSDKVNEMISADFGLVNALGTAKSKFGAGSLATFTARQGYCANQDAFTPYFTGVMRDLTGNGFFDFFLKGGGIDFHVLGLNMNLKTKTVTDMNLYLTLKPGIFYFSCIDNADAEKEFTTNANTAIKDMLNKVGENPALQQLAPLLN